MSGKKITDFSDQLYHELAWRKKELSTLRFSLNQVTDEQQIESISRASIVMLYAHWEGFIKAAARSYLKHVRLNTISPADLSYLLYGFVATYLLLIGHLIQRKSQS